MNARHRRNLRWFRERWEPLGYTAVYSRRNSHYKVYDPDGHLVTSLSSTPKNAKSPEREGESDLRRHHKQMQENDK
ncbi:hypothetical protein GCM10027517_03160 [Phycicoccus ginsengisoli]